MTEWTAKRFWSDVATEPVDGGFQLLLDGRPVKTPGRRLLVLPAAEMAEVAAAEWAAQGEVIDPMSMPVTRSANSALDQTAPQRDAVIDMLAAYAETDLLCYRAEDPVALADRQEEAWAPLLDWSAQQFDAPLVATSGVLPVAQSEDSLRKLHGAVSAYGNFGLTGLHDLIVLSGSIVLGLAVATGRLDAEAGWTLSRIDEDWQISQWGTDEEAEKKARDRFAAFDHASRFVGWSGTA